MLKLESFKDDKFILSERENSMVNGGYVDISYEESMTKHMGDPDTLDRTVSDICMYDLNENNGKT